jgi:hypothetical protein
MKVISREVSKYPTDSVVTYKFSNGYMANQWNCGSFFVYTKSGNYARQVTMHKYARIISEYEDCRVQFPD